MIMPKMIRAKTIWKAFPKVSTKNSQLLSSRQMGLLVAQQCFNRRSSPRRSLLEPASKLSQIVLTNGNRHATSLSPIHAKP